MLPAQNNRQFPAAQPLYFDDFITRDGWNAARQQAELQMSPMPATNAYETEKAFFIELVVPGLTLEDLQFFVTDDQIEVRYTPDDHDFEPYGSRRQLHREYRPAAFQRTLQLNPQALDLDGLEVRAADGVVRIQIPKRTVSRGPLPLIVPFSLN